MGDESARDPHGAARRRPRPFGFPPEKRLRKRSDFLRVQSRGIRIHGRRFIFYLAPGATATARLGITVSKKVGHAVQRNHIKRRVREAFRQHPDLFPRPVDVVVIAKRDVEDFSYRAIEAELVDVVTRHFARQSARPAEGSGPRRGRGGPPPRPGRPPRDRGV